MNGAAIYYQLNECEITIKLLFIHEPQQGIRLWCLIILSVVLMVLDHHYHRLDQVRHLLSDSAYPIQLMIDTPIRFTSLIKQYVQKHCSLVQENESLKQTLFEQEGRLQQLLALEAENEQLRNLLQASKKIENSLKVVEILKVDTDPFHHRIVLNKGETDGVTIGQPIIDAKGLIGEVVEIFGLSSRAMLITDASHAVPVENVRNGVRGIVVGTGALDSLKLQHVPITADLKVGDVLVTSGLGGRFPSGYPVGVITEISEDSGESFAMIRLKPSADLDRGRQVLLLQKQNDGESGESTPTSSPKSDQNA